MELSENSLPEQSPEVASESTIIAELEKTEISMPDNKSNTIMTVGDGSAQPGHNLTTMRVQLTSPASAGQHEPSPRVKVKIQYPKGFKGTKHFVDESIREVALETAEQFVAAGIASIIEK